MSDKLAFSIREAAEATTISEWKLREMCYRGDIASKKVGARLIIPRWSLERWLDTPAPHAESEPLDSAKFLA